MENQAVPDGKMYCRHCGEVIDADCVVCPKCGKQVGEIKQQNPQVVINNTNTNTNTSGAYAAGAAMKPKNKWVAFFLCLFLGGFGAHKFYEGKILLGVVYLFTVGLFGIGWFIDLVKLLFKPNPYYA